MPAASPKTFSPPFAASPFARLVSHFVTRLVAGGQDASSEFELGWGALLGLLAVPGAFQSLLLLDKYSTFLGWLRGGRRQDLLIASAPDKYLLISMAMAITGILTWRPCPSARAPILLANAAAIAMAVVVVALNVSGVSAVLLPLFVTAAMELGLLDYLQFAAVHAFCLILASVFTFCAVFAVLGSLAAILPRETFRAASSWIRGTLLVAFLALLGSSYTAPVLLGRLERDPHSLVRWLPSFWFLGLYQTLQHRATPMLAALARMALPGTAAALALLVVSYGLSNRRRFAAVLEAGRRPREQRLLALPLAFLDLFAPRRPGFGRACHRFVVRALLRNEAHRVAISVALGLGWLLAFQQAATAPLEAPLVAAYLLMLGLRVAFEIPAGVPPNWIFRAALDPRNNESLGVARRVMLAFLAGGVLLPWAVVAWRQWGLAGAVSLTLSVLALSLCLIEALLAGYRKLPLACPIPGFRDNLLVLCLVQFLGYQLFTRAGAAVELWTFNQPLRFLLLPAAMAAAWHWNQRRLRDAREAGELEEGLTFENIHRPAVERLDLSGSG